MNLFSSLKQEVINYLEPYKTKEPASYAAAEQALGAILITDGFIGISNPFGRKRRSGILGALGGVVFSIIFMFAPALIGGLSGINSMTAQTSAKVVSVGQPNFSRDSRGNTSSSCGLTASYTVNGQEYANQTSRMSSSENCSLSVGQTININYDPANPGSWAFGAQTTKNFLKIFFWAGLVVFVSSIVTFFIRLFSIIFGWKLWKSGRRDAAKLPAGTNLQTMINEIKQNFVASTFGFGGTQNSSVGSDTL